MEIERKFTVKNIPTNLDEYPFRHIEQAYLNTNPVIRIRKEDDEYYMTYKGSGMMAREEYNLPLTMEAYYHLLLKADGRIISKRRYLIPLNNPQFRLGDGHPAPPDDYTLTIELDVFEGELAPLVIAEVEFGSKESAQAFLPPEWFGEDVTYHKEYHNAYLALCQLS